MAATLTIGGVVYTMIEDQHDLTTALGERQRFKCDVIDYTGQAHFTKGQSVVIADPSLGLFYTGVLNGDKEVTLYPSGAIIHTIDCIDFGQYIAGKRTFTGVYATPAKAAKIAIDQVSSILGPEGINQNYANRYETTATDFNQGILVNTVGTTSVGDGDLELAPSGTSLAYTENTTAQFGSGTLTNVVASNNTLAPTATNALKIVANMNFTGPIAAATYVKIWSGSLVFTANTLMSYDVFIDPSSPEIKAGVQLFFSDGSVMVGTLDYQGFAFNDPSVDLTGFANVGWFSRGSILGGNSGKTLISATLVVAGTKPGIYTAYVRNIQITGGPTATIFNGTLNVNPPQQLQSYGYGNTVVSVVPSYDLYVPTTPTYGAKAVKQTGAISVSAVKLLRSSFLSYQVAQPTNTQLLVSYSLDGNAYIPCVNNAPLPNLPAGTDLTSKSIYLQYEFYGLTGANVELTPILKSVQLTLNTSYAATKSDVSYAVDTQALWNAGTLTSLQANSSNELQLIGRILTWYQGYFTSGPNQQTPFSAASASPPAGIQGVLNRIFFLQNIEPLYDERSQLVGIGQYQNFTMEVDINVTTGLDMGVVYRTTYWGNANNTFAYVVGVNPTTIYLSKGTNSSSGSYTNIGTVTPTITTGWHRLKVIVSGNNHYVYLDDILQIYDVDSSFTATGYIGLRAYNSTSSGPNLIANFANFGIVPSVTGTWLSPSTNLTAAGTYGTSIISWRDKGASYNEQTNTTILVEASINGGSTYQTCTNGSAIPNFTANQSLNSVNLLIRVTLTTSTAGSLPAIDNLVVRVLGAYSTSGTRSTAPIGNDMSITRTVGSGWGTAFDGQTWTQVGTGTTAVATGEETITNTTGDVHMVLGSRTWTDEDGTVRFSLSNGAIVGGMELRYVDANNHYRLSTTTSTITLTKVSVGVTSILATASVSLTTNTWYRMRFRVVGSGPINLYGRVWADQTLENQAVWSITATD